MRKFPNWAVSVGFALLATEAGAADPKLQITARDGDNTVMRVHGYQLTLRWRECGSNNSAEAVEGKCGPWQSKKAEISNDEWLNLFRLAGPFLVLRGSVFRPHDADDDEIGERADDLRLTVRRRRDNEKHHREKTARYTAGTDVGDAPAAFRDLYVALDALFDKHGLRTR